MLGLSSPTGGRREECQLNVLLKHISRRLSKPNPKMETWSRGVASLMICEARLVFYLSMLLQALPFPFASMYTTMSNASEADRMIISALSSGDVEECGELRHEGFKDHLDRFVLPGMTLTPQEWKAKQTSYRKEYMKYVLDHGEERGIVCKVMRNEAKANEVVSFIVWQDPEILKRIDSGRIGPKEPIIPGPKMLTEIDKKAWQAMGSQYERYRKEEYPDEKVVDVDMLAVKHCYRGRGLASEMLTMFLESIQYRDVFLVSQPEAVSLYKRHGFSITSMAMQDGGLRVPIRDGEDQAARNNWPMARHHQDNRQ